ENAEAPHVQAKKEPGAAPDRQIDRRVENELQEEEIPEDVDVDHITVFTKADPHAPGSDRLQRRAEPEEQEQEIEEEQGPSRPIVHVQRSYAGRSSDSVAAAAGYHPARAPPAFGPSLANSPETIPASQAQGACLNPGGCRGPPIALGSVDRRIQCSWLGDAWNAVSGFAGEALQWVEQGLDAAKRWLLGKVRDFVRAIPGYRMLSFVLGEDPITGEPMERSGTNLLYAGLDLLPAGALFRAVLERIGAVPEIAAYLDRRISDLVTIGG